MTYRHWIIVGLLLFFMFFVDNLLVDPLMQASKTMQEVQTVIEPKLDKYTEIDFLLEKVAKIEQILYDGKLVNWNDSQSLQGIDYKWLKQQCSELQQKVEEEIKKIEEERKEK